MQHLGRWVGLDPSSMLQRTKIYLDMSSNCSSSLRAEKGLLPPLPAAPDDCFLCGLLGVAVVLLDGDASLFDKMRFGSK